MMMLALSGFVSTASPRELIALFANSLAFSIG